MGLQGAWDERWTVLADGLRGLRRRQRGVLARPAVPGGHERVLPGRMGKRAPGGGRPHVHADQPFAESVGGVWVSDHLGFVAEFSVPDVCS